jgi:N-acetylneuraminate synthase
MTVNLPPVGHVYIIAEAGVNHNGDKALALKLVDAAAKAGADAVKFQTFKAERLTTETSPKAAYQEANGIEGESQFAMLKRLELSQEAHFDLVARCSKLGIDFLSSPFDIESLRFLVDDLRLKTVKIGSGEITNGPLLLEAARSDVQIFLSTGMSTMEEIEEALSVLAFGLKNKTDEPSRQALRSELSSSTRLAAIRDRVTLLHCTSEYPAPVSDVNLRAMQTIQKKFGISVGISDHTKGNSVSIAAAALGASIIEKHFTLDRSLPGPDHGASLEPLELKEMVSGVRTIQQALGDSVKKPAVSEIKNRDIVRKSLVALRPISIGEPFSRENLGCLRPGDGLSPMVFWERLGQLANRSYAAGEKVTS